MTGLSAEVFYLVLNERGEPVSAHHSAPDADQACWRKEGWRIKPMTWAVAVTYEAPTEEASAEPELGTQRQERARVDMWADERARADAAQAELERVRDAALRFVDYCTNEGLDAEECEPFAALRQALASLEGNGSPPESSVEAPPQPPALVQDAIQIVTDLGARLGRGEMVGGTPYAIKCWSAIGILEGALFSGLPKSEGE